MEIDAASIARYWQQTDGGMYSVLRGMEASESWVIDQPQKFESRVVALGQAIERIDLDRCTDSEREALHVLLAFFRAGRAFRILWHLESEAPGWTAALLQEAQQRAAAPTDEVSPESALAAQIHIDRFSYLDRFRLLGRIYSRERLEHLQSILERIA